MANFNRDDFYLRLIMALHWGDIEYCPKCGEKAAFYRIASRKSYSCSHCGYHLAPLAGTLFHKSNTPLSKWFQAIELYASSEGKISAKELERQLGVTYKTAWRIRQQLKQLK